MPTTLIEPVENIVEAPVGPARKKWTRSEIAALEKSGVLNVEYLELIDGELYDKMGKYLPHVNTLHRLLLRLFEIFGGARVTQERPIDVASKDRPSNDPVPDIVVLNRSFDSFKSVPQPNELLLVVEVSDTTLRFDLKIKAALYARAGIGDYWVVDVNGRKLIVHREPKQGRYSSVVIYGVDEAVSPLAAPEHSVEVRTLFD